MNKEKLYSLILTDTERKLETVVDNLRDGKITMNQAREKFNFPPLEDMKVKIAIPRSAKTQLDKNEALEIAIEKLKANDRNKMIVDDIRKIIKKYDDMNLTVSFEERRENHIKAYMEIKDYFNNCEK